MATTLQKTTAFPHTFEEFLIWESADGFNGAARAV